MTRFAALALLSSLIAAPAAAQVINGETPLDETKIKAETPRQGNASRSPPSAVDPTPVHPQDRTPTPDTPRD